MSTSTRIPPEGDTATLMAASRDASVYNYPGVAYVVHVAVIDLAYPDQWYAACGRYTILDESLGWVAGQVPARIRCRRSGCRIRWPATAPKKG